MKHLDQCLVQSTCPIKVSLAHYYYSAYRAYGSREKGAISGEIRRASQRKRRLSLDVKTE